MKFDLTKLRQQAISEKEELEEKKAKQSGDNNIPLMYPYQAGKYRLKILANEKSQIIQRKLIRHTVGNEKIPCLEQYGEECPICRAISECEQTYGRDCGAWKKYHRGERGICYAVIMDHDPKVLTGKDDAKTGDLVLFMYPITLYNMINDIIIDSGSHIENVFAKNEGRTIEVVKTPENRYTCSVYPYGDEKVKETDEEFEELMMKIPALSEAMGVPSKLSDEDLKKARAAADAIVAEYAEGKVINPDTKFSDDKPEDKKEEDNGGSISSVAKDEPKEESKTEVKNKDTPSENKESTDNGLPPCFGKHSDSSKCFICDHEVDCLMKTE